MADGRLRVGGYASGDRYPRYYLLWAGLLLAAGLFHRSTDPDETHNLIAELPDVAASARARREAWLRSTAEPHLPQSPPPTTDAEAPENLRGYIR